MIDLSEKDYHIIRRVFGTGNYYVYESIGDIKVLKFHNKDSH